MGAMTRSPAPAASGPAMMTEYQPTLRDRVARVMSGDSRLGSVRNLLTDRLMGSTGIGQTRMGLIDYTPFGAPFWGEEAGRTIADGHPMSGVADLALAAIPIPAAAKAGKGMVKAAGRAAEKVADRVTRGILNTPDLRALSHEEAVAAAKSQPHLIPVKDKTFVGGPANVKGPRQLQAMRDAFDAQVAAGIAGADWYPRARAFNTEITGANPAKSSLAAQEQALWSAQATPDTNLNFALQGHNAYEAGKPAEQVRTGQQARTYSEARGAGIPVPLGQKTGIYGQHLDPTQPFATTGTNDIWHARAFGYTNSDGGQFSRALTPQEHRFLDYETILATDRANAAKLGGRSDWAAHEIQAAPWVAGKGAGLAGPGGDVQAGVAEASRTYPDYADKYTALATHEDQPGVMTGHLPDLGKASPEERAAYAADPRSGWKDANGRDQVYDAMGAYVRPTQEATGLYTPPGGVTESNPAHVARPLVGMKSTDQGPVVDDASRAMLDAGEAFRAYMDAQGAGAWHKPVLNAPAGQSGSVFVPMDRHLTLEEVMALKGPGEAHGLPDVVDTGRGATLTNFYDGPPSGADTGKALKTTLTPQITDVLPGAEPKRVKVDSGYAGYEDAWAKGEGSGAATQQLFDYLDKPEAPAIMQKLDASPELRARVLGKMQRDAELASSTGQPVRADLQRARDIFSKEGFAGLSRALKEGGLLPAVAGPILALGLAGQQPVDPQPQPVAPGA